MCFCELMKFLQKVVLKRRYCCIFALFLFKLIILSLILLVFNKVKLHKSSPKIL